MKKIIFLLTMLLLPRFAFAQFFTPQVNTCIYKTTFTVTNTENSNIANVKFFKSVLISSASATGILYIYDSIFSTQTASLISIIDLTARAYYPYDIFLSSGLTIKIIGITGVGSLNIQYRE